jgi:hypothetical protein
MAAGVLSKPGTNAGPCAEPCHHKDCAETRGMAAALCVYCGKPIGYDERFYQEGRALSHAECSEEAKAAQ